MSDLERRLSDKVAKHWIAIILFLAGGLGASYMNSLEIFRDGMSDLGDKMDSMHTVVNGNSTGIAVVGERLVNHIDKQKQFNLNMNSSLESVEQRLASLESK